MPKRLVQAARDFLRLEAAAGIVLFGAAVLAVIASNSPLSGLYDHILEMPLRVTLGAFGVDKPLVLWINDGLMAVFFLLVGLEIKREILDGELSTPAQIALPAVAALGGMAVPAAIYVMINWQHPAGLAGWAIPSATDIAFSLGVLSLLGSRVPLSLKIFLTAVAIYDDLGAIVIIALFYTDHLSLLALSLAGGAILVLTALNLAGVTRIAAYVICGIALWLFVLKSGVHATLAGVAMALAIPLRGRDEEGHSPLRHLEYVLHPWVAFGVLPIFGVANAGVSFGGMSLARLMEPVTLGTALGLFLGKQIGIFGSTWMLIKLKLARLPEGATWGMLYGAATLALWAALRGLPFILEPTVPYLAGLAYLALIASVLAFACYLTLLGRIGAARAAYVTVMLPVVALAVSTVLEGYRWTIPAGLGLAAVLAGNLLVLRSPRLRTPGRPP